MTFRFDAWNEPEPELLPAAFQQVGFECYYCGATYMQETDEQGRLLPSLHDCQTGEWEPA